ncbi:MAG: hypothetical protein MI862_20225, partial [Desulfobacterales bacterium]|nr:hypothetical protein [Desulfobacterales bacterium]
NLQADPDPDTIPSLKHETDDTVLFDSVSPDQFQGGPGSVFQKRICTAKDKSVGRRFSQT